ncbi:hypothetical protein CspHIS471_0605410 [Cutaneotrichosporon sp. HIS471]|nr:hypothetical protein CspHIS471_0605410 [Cutaneotrichosporon sp. HIS471]
MAIFKKKAKTDREHGARSPTNSPPVQVQPSMIAAVQRGVSDSFAPPNASIGQNPKRMTNSVQFGAIPPSVLQSPQTGRASPGPGGLPLGQGGGYPVGMGLPSSMQQGHPQHQQQASLSSINGPLSPLAMVSAQHMGPPGAMQQPQQYQQFPQQTQPQQQGGGLQQIPPHNPGYPWSTRPLRLYQPREHAQPLSPFPRYGLSVPPYPSHSGHMLLFGGLVADRAHNDLWSLDVRDHSLQLVKTRGEAPLPRIGHVSAIADRIMLVFGGDTKVDEKDKQDEGLYVLDLRTQEWSHIPVVAGPCGRYGHAACMLGGYFYVHGGHVDGKNFDDLWSFDIRQLGRNDGQYTWERITYNSPAPLARTGHTIVPYQNQLFLFGGTDGDYHYNDSWSFDIATGVWTELECIGYIPIPREGHAAAIVDDVVYVFGGRDVHGKDLGDLAAFRISNKRWYMFQNMGPAPMAKSGHSLCAAHGKVFVIGGESNLAPEVPRDDPNLIHILDTGKIKYPSDSQAPGGARAPQQVRPRTTSDATDRRPANGGSPNGSSPYGMGSSGNAQAAYMASRSVDNVSRAMSPPQVTSEPRPLIVTNDTGGKLTKHTPRSESLDSAGPPSAGLRMNGQAQPMGVPQPMMQGNPLPQGAPPQRPRREGDEEYRRAMSPPEVTINGTPNTSSSSPTNESVVTPNGDVVTPVARRRSMSPPPPGHVPSHTVHPNMRNSRSPPPQLRVGEDGRPALPPDAFYFSGKSPTGGSRPGSLLGRPGSLLGRPGSIIGNRPGSVAGTADLLREIKARETEADSAKRREGALRVLLGKAIEQGYVVDEDVADVPPPGNLGNNEQLRHVALALKQLKQEKANLQNEVTLQMQLASDKIQDSERLQKAALQEAAYYRAKLTALEAGDTDMSSKIDAGRIGDLERQLESTTTEYTGGQRELERLKSEVEHHQKICHDATEAETETLKRAEVAEEAVAQLQEEIETLRDHAANHDRSTREQTERFITLTSTQNQREAERDDYKTQLDDLQGKNDEFALLLEQAQASMAATSIRADEFESLHDQAKEQVGTLEQELAETKRALEDKTHEAEQASARLAKAEGLHTSAREEVSNYRSLTSGRLGELLESHRALREDNTRGVKGHQDQLRALEEEKGSLLKLLRDAGERVDATEAVASSHRKKARELEQQHLTVRGDMRAQRTKLAAAQNELAKYRALFTNKDSELHERDQAVTELQTRVSLMRKLLGEHGINVSDADLESAETSSAGELESKLRDKSRAHDTAQREIDELKRRCEEAEDKADSLARMVERYKDARSPSAGSIHSGDGEGGDANQRAREAERKLADVEEAHLKRLTALQSDYETAVRYVKGTEKMLKRMKDELNKQKATNTTLLSDLDGMRGRAGSPPTRGLSGRTTPSDGELMRKVQTLQNQYAALQAELEASQDTLNARNREWELLRTRVEENERESERENEALRKDLFEAQHRIETLLEINPAGIMGSDDDDDRLGGLRRGSTASSDGGTSMAFDKFTKELKQWERARSPDAHDEEDDHGLNGKAVSPNPATPAFPTAPGMPTRNNVSGEWK